MRKLPSLIKGQMYRLYLFIAALLIAVMGIMPFMMAGRANAAVGQIGDRSLSISSGVPSATGVSYTFTIALNDSSVTNTAIQSLRFIACTVAINSYPTANYPSDCTAPTGLDFSVATGVTQSNWTDSTAFTIDSTGNSTATYPEGCNPSANEMCLTRTSSTTEDTSTGKTITIQGVTNPQEAAGTPNGTPFYVGVFAYTNADYTSLAYFGATASAVSQSLKTQAIVAEVLNFCVGATTVDDATTNPTPNGNQDCTQIGGTAVNIGTLSTGQVNVSPVSTNGGNGDNGIAMVRSNAGNGVGIYYDAIPAAGSTNHKGALRIAGGTCDATNDYTDDCINSIGTTQSLITAGTEDFGMTIAGVNCGSTTSYTCDYSTGAYNLVPQSPYIGESGNVFCSLATCNTSGTGNGFAWDETGASTLIASSASSTVPQVDDEALILKFAATPEITTPFGQYSVQTDFTAVPEY